MVVNSGVRRWALVVLATGIAIVLISNAGDSARPAPLFDGLFVEEPYRYVDPSAGLPGDPFAISETKQVVGGTVALIATATGEVPPQAQVIAEADAFAISGDTTSIVVSIQPESAHDAGVLGNLYRIQVVDQVGTLLKLRPGSLVTVVLRAPEANPEARIARRDGDAWTELATDNGGLPDLLAANVDELGQFAVFLATRSSPSPLPSAAQKNGAAGDLPIWLLVAFVVAALGVGLLWGWLGDPGQR